ncbi:MAG: BLUF domain-containing protein [Saccharospirillum sp.]
MSEPFVQLTYASEANFSSNQRGGVETEVARILLQSRRNNPKDRLGGVLHYGNGYFFQCLEGERDKVTAAYERIATDPRHTRVQMLGMNTVQRRRFTDWSMKYVALDSDIQALLAQHNLKAFDPYAFNSEVIDQLIDLFAGASDDERYAPANPGYTKTKPSWWARLLGKG